MNDIKKKIAGIKKFSKKISASKKKSLDFLVGAGICTQKGNLKKVYK